MNTRVPRSCLIVWGVMLALSPLILSPPGDLWPWFGIMALVAVVPAVVVGPTWQRILGIAALVASLGLVVMDVHAGRERKERRQRLRIQSGQSSESETNRLSQPASLSHEGLRR